MKWYEKLKFARKVMQLTLREVADLTGMSNPYICEIEHGQISDPSFFKIVKLLKLYNLKFEDIEDEI
ncbi:MAG: helix-turn-helix transcriptional regulator [Deltaproteobacteria bacterium]|nr:helix-turn-helix transcriptional regulator [Deltaproteobacteria bacterium]